MAQPSQRDFQKKASPSPVAALSQAMAPRPFAPQADVAAPDVQARDVATPDALTLDSAPAFPNLNFQIRAAGGSPPPLQPKLTIGAPNDKYEQEADRVAAQVVQRIHSPAANLPTEKRAYQAQSVQRQAWPEQPVLQMQPTLQRETLPDEDDELQMKPMIQRLEMAEDDELQMKPMPQRSAMPPGVKLQMKSASSEGVVEGNASPDLEAGIQRARGHGQALSPTLQMQMGQAMGADFSGVRVHTDTQSDQLNRSIQAKAFTTGKDIFFREGAYNPSSHSGQELLAHELTHVVQQTGTQSSSLPSLSRQMIQRTTVKTMGGEWETIKYEKYEFRNTHGGVEGADIKLEFKPNQIVNAEKIGLTQTIRTLKEGDPWYLGDNEGEQNIAKSRTIQDGSDKGTSIDRIPKAGVNNPIYGALGGDENMDIANTQMPEQDLDESEAGQKVGGAYNRLGKRVPNEDPISAVLSDTPKRIVPLPRDSMCEFETTALALEGTQKGTYYGSVKWGWQTDKDGELELIDFEKVKEGNPTKRFADSAQAWNQGQSRYQLFKPFKTSGGNIKLPVANPDSKQLLPLPDVSVYKAIKNNAKKKNTPLSGMMPVKTYKQLRSEYENARQADDTNQMIQTLAKLTSKLNAMDAKGDKYWQSPALKAQYFDPFNDAIQGQYRLLQEPTS